MTEDDVKRLEDKLYALRLATSRELDRRVAETFRKAASGAKENTNMAALSMAQTDAPARPSARAFRLTLKWAGVPLAAAVLLAAALVFFVRPPEQVTAYAALAEAVKNSQAAEWVHMTLEVDGKPCEIWFSFSPFRQVTKDSLKRQIRYIDAEVGKEFTYEESANSITVRECRTQAPGESLFNWVSMSLKEAEKRGESVTRKLEFFRGKEADVWAVSGDSDTFTAYVDPGQNRIIRIVRTRKESDGQERTLDYTIAYPARGPIDIYEAGAPRGAQVIDAAPVEKTSTAPPADKSSMAALREAVESSRTAEWVHIKREVQEGVLVLWISFRPLQHFHVVSSPSGNGSGGRTTGSTRSTTPARLGTSSFGHLARAPRDGLRVKIWPCEGPVWG